MWFFFFPTSLNYIFPFSEDSTTLNSCLSIRCRRRHWLSTHPTLCNCTDRRLDALWVLKHSGNVVHSTNSFGWLTEWKTFGSGSKFILGWKSYKIFKARVESCSVSFPSFVPASFSMWACIQLTWELVKLVTRSAANPNLCKPNSFMWMHRFSLE